jgi:DeoR/GlpR family transcriptional regulator of sugar metabolism
LQDLTADIVFLGTDGLTVDGGVSTVNILMAEVDRMMTERARKVVLVVDSSKLGRISFVPVKAVTAFHLIITDTGADPEIVEKIREQGVEVLLV